MAQSSPTIIKLLSFCVTAANRAGKIIRDVMSKGELNIVEKGINDLQTEADRSAQKCIIESISRQFPKINIIGEEVLTNSDVPSDWIVTNYDNLVLTKSCPDKFKKLSNEDIVVWVDPLDGTSEYTQGLVEHVTVLIGFAVDGKAVGGVIHQPYFNRNGDNVGRTIWGLEDVGVGGFDPKKPPSDKFIVTTTRSHSDERVQAALDAIGADEVLRVGGAGHKVMLLMEGKANAYVFASKGCKKWDTCAPEAILKVLGGKLTNVHGDSYSYDKNVNHPNTGGVIATAAGVDHSSIINKLPNSIKEFLK